MQNDSSVESTKAPVDTSRHFLAVFFLSFMWGAFGVDRFYLGKVWTGLLKLITFGGFGLWTLIDLVLIMSGAMKDKHGNPMREATRYKKFAIKTVLIFAITAGLLILITGASLIAIVYSVVTGFLEGGASGALPFEIPGVTDSPLFEQYNEVQSLLNTDPQTFDINSIDPSIIDSFNQQSN